MDIKEKLKLMYENPVISWHEHVWFKEVDGRPTEELDMAHCDRQIEVADWLGVDKLVVSLPVLNDKHCPPERFILANNLVHKAIKRYPDRLYGMAFVNPGYQKGAVAEVERCVKELGFVGLKLYHQYFMDDPVQNVLVEKCIELDIPILMHAAALTKPGGVPYSGQPRLTDGTRMAAMARRYPEATFIMAHIGGGGNWQWQIRAIADCPNVYADISGSVYERSLVEESVRLLGADRLLFGADGMWSASVGKILGAEISEDEKKKILRGASFVRFLERMGR